MKLLLIIFYEITPYIIFFLGKLAITPPIFSYKENK